MNAHRELGRVVSFRPIIVAVDEVDNIKEGVEKRAAEDQHVAEKQEDVDPHCLPQDEDRNLDQEARVDGGHCG